MHRTKIITGMWLVGFNLFAAGAFVGSIIVMGFDENPNGFYLLPAVLVCMWVGVSGAVELFKHIGAGK